MKPMPVIDPGTQPYWDALKQNRLSLKHCKTCDQVHFYPRELCPHCYSDNLDWIDASGGGVIYSYTVAHRPAGPAFAEDVPYTIAIIDLDEGPRMMSRITNPESGVRIGARVQVRFQPADDGLVLPVFEMVAD